MKLLFPLGLELQGCETGSVIDTLSLREKKKMPEVTAKLGEAGLGYGTKAMHDGDVISASYQFVLILRLFIPVLLVAFWIGFPGTWN